MRLGFECACVEALIRAYCGMIGTSSRYPRDGRQTVTDPRRAARSCSSTDLAWAWHSVSLPRRRSGDVDLTRLWFTRYATLLNYFSTSSTLKDRPILVLIQPNISMSFFQKNYLNPLEKDATAAGLKQIAEARPSGPSVKLSNSLTVPPP